MLLMLKGKGRDGKQCRKILMIISFPDYTCYSIFLLFFICVFVFCVCVSFSLVLGNDTKNK